MKSILTIRDLFVVGARRIFLRKAFAALCLLTVIYPLASPAKAQQPLVHYTFDGNAQDVTGNGFDGVVVGSPAFVASPTGQGIYFDNPFEQATANQYVTLPDLSFLDMSSFTIALRMKTTDTTTHNGRLFGYAQDMVFDYQAGYDNGAIQVGKSIGNNDPITLFGAAAGPAGFIADGDWHWMILTRNTANGTVKGYFDQATDQKNFSSAESLSFSDLWLGAVNGPLFTDRWYAARLTTVDDFRIYDHALTDAQVSTLIGVTAAAPEPGTLALFAPLIVGGILLRRRIR